MKKGKKFLSLFLAAALAVTGINLGAPATANAAGESKNVTIKYVDASGDNAIKEKEVYITPDNGGTVTYNVPDEDKEFTATADDGKQYKYTLNESASKLVASPDDAPATSGQTEKKFTIVLRYTKTLVTPPESGQFPVVIKYMAGELEVKTSKTVNLTPDDGGNLNYDVSENDKKGVTYNGKEYVYDTENINNGDRRTVSKNAQDKTIVLYFKAQTDDPNPPTPGTVKNYVTVKRVCGETLLDAGTRTEFTGDVPASYQTTEQDKTYEKDNKKYKLIETKTYTYKLDSTGDNANNYIVTLEYEEDTSTKPDATGDDADAAYMTSLTEKITDAQNALKAGAKKTQSAKNTLKAAIAEAQKVVDNFEDGKKVTKKMVDDAVEALDAAIKAFNASKDETTTPPPAATVNKTQLQAAIVAAQALKASDYTAASWAPFQTALSDAAKVNDNKDATQAQVNAALVALTNAQNALKKAVKSLTITDNLTGAKSSKTIKVAAGKKVTLKATAAPADAANKSVKWSIDKKFAKYAKVSSKGVVTTTKKGAGKTVVVKATANDGSNVTKTVKVQIMGKMVTSVKFKKAPKTAKIGKSFTLKTTIKFKGKGKANKTLKWTSNKPNIAKVNSKGKVTISKKAKKGQKVKITATATDGSGKKATVTIKIKK